MPTARRQMHLGVFVLGTGNHMAGWRTDGALTTHMELPVMQEIARIAERGQIRHAVHLQLDGDGPDRPSVIPVRLRADHADHRVAACTTHVGLGATVSTSFSEPYNVARVFGSIDHISGGRAGWNVVTSSNPKAALNSTWTSTSSTNTATPARTNSSMSCAGLWDCWDDGAIVADKATGLYVDAGKVRALNHRGKFFKVRGPLNMARCPQGHPVIIQAGGSPSGLELAARTADVVFSVVQETGARQGRLRRPEGPHGQVRPRPGRTRGAARRDDDHRRKRRPRRGRNWQGCKAGSARPMRRHWSPAGSATTCPAIRSTGRCRRPPPALNSQTFSSCCMRWRGART